MFREHMQPNSLLERLPPEPEGVQASTDPSMYARRICTAEVNDETVTSLRAGSDTAAVHRQVRWGAPCLGRRPHYDCAHARWVAAAARSDRLPGAARRRRRCRACPSCTSGCAGSCRGARRRGSGCSASGRGPAGSGPARTGRPLRSIVSRRAGRFAARDGRCVAVGQVLRQVVGRHHLLRATGPGRARRGFRARARCRATSIAAGDRAPRC